MRWNRQAEKSISIFLNDLTQGIKRESDRFWNWASLKTFLNPSDHRLKAPPQIGKLEPEFSSENI